MTLRVARLATLASLLPGLLWPVKASGQVLAGRFYPEKQTYLVGEPVFIDFEVSNAGHEPVWVDGRMGEPCIAPSDSIEVVGAKSLGWDSSSGCFGGVAGECAGNDIRLKPGEKHIGRIFLSSRFRLDHAGVYEVQAHRSVPVSLDPHPDTTPSGWPIRQDFSADFQILLARGTEEELKAAFQPYATDASTPEVGDHWEAVWAIEETAPPFLEDLILKLADTPNRADPDALRRLNTPKAKAKLVELAEQSKYDWIQQEAISALAETGDRAYLPVLLRIARASPDGNGIQAIQAVGLLGGEDAIPFLVSKLSDSGIFVRQEAVRGLVLTASRRAVVILIGTLRDPDPRIFQEAAIGLAELTHHSITKEPWGERPSPEAYRRWHDWWLLNGSSAPIYSISDCAIPQPLD